ncbi:nucleic acid/nucleotide deaminase domain-containing protein [Salininema proteolyticum]|uniref:Nucleic acid/nucleotide deaminase domain-containing protein n=1 Tax=Salininema proteolyticum TaxID=1607685 RepID=A0ABV8U1R5_9ACTN
MRFFKRGLIACFLLSELAFHIRRPDADSPRRPRRTGLPGNNRTGDGDVVRQDIETFRARKSEVTQNEFNDVDPRLKEQARDYYGRDYGTQVDYGSEGLPERVANYRNRRDKDDGTSFLEPGKNRNVAGAYVEDGNGNKEYIADQSGKNKCAEANLRDQLESMNEGREGNDRFRMTEMYSERQPCCRCEDMFENPNVPPPMDENANISWTSEYFDSTDRNTSDWSPADREWVKKLNAAQLDALQDDRLRFHGLL